MDFFKASYSKVADWTLSAASFLVFVSGVLFFAAYNIKDINGEPSEVASQLFFSAGIIGIIGILFVFLSITYKNLHDIYSTDKPKELNRIPPVRRVIHSA